MKPFIPLRVYYEEVVTEYEQGQEINATREERSCKYPRYFQGTHLRINKLCDRAIKKYNDKR